MSGSGGIVRRAWRAFVRDRRGASAVEFALVASPFIMLLLCILQMGVYYMTQAALDAGMVRTADNLRISFNAASPTFPSASQLKSNVASNAGGLVSNGANLAVDLRQLANLSSGAVAITDGTADYGTTTSVLVLRAQASITTFAPGFSGLAKVSSSALVRRQGR